VKFLHTADWQIGMKAVHVRSAGQRVRDDCLVAARRVVQAAKNANAEFMLVARDTFDDNRGDRMLIWDCGLSSAQFFDLEAILRDNVAS
jgi:DNA repair exonuclease SbcCD nuclease subunit